MYVTKTTVCALLVCAAAIIAPGPVAGKPAATTKSSRLAKYTTLCSVKDTKLSECLTRVMEDILKYASTGIPELKIPKFEPLFIPEIDLKVFEGLSTMFGGNPQRSDKTRAFARNLTIHHSSEFILNKFKSDVVNNQFYIDMSFPKLQIEGQYDVNLIMFGMPIKSVGPVHVNATDIDVKATIDGKTIKRKHESYLFFNSIDIKVSFKDYSFVIEKLFKKDQNMNRALNDMIKSQKAELRKLTMPMIEELAGKMVLQMINQILSDLPLEEIFIME